MEKKIWTMPQVSVQEFAPNEYMAACSIRVSGNCAADDHVWWRWHDENSNGTVDYSGIAKSDEIHGFFTDWDWTDRTDHHSHWLSSNDNCDDNKASDGYVQADYNRVAGITTTQWKAFQGGSIGIADLLWKTGYAIMSWGGLTGDDSNFGIHVYTSITSLGDKS